MKLTCVFLVLIGASFAMAATNTAMSNMTTAAKTTPMMTTPMPDETTFRLNNSNNAACILEQLQADFSIMYDMVNAQNKTVKSEVSFVLPQEATVDAKTSKCGVAASNGAKATMPKLTLVFDAPKLGNKFEQVFTMSGNNSALSTITLALNHTAVMFPNSTQAGQLVMYTATLPSATFMVSNGRSYLCNSLQKFRINETANVTFSRVKVQTADIIDNNFGNESQCPQDTGTTSAMPATTNMTTAMPNMTTTTAMPNMTTTTNMTTAAKTTPMMTTPMPDETTFRLNNSNNSACILEQLQADFSIMYEMVNAQNKTVKSKIPFILPQVAIVDANNSECGVAASNGANATMPKLTLIFDAPELGNKFEQVFTMSGNNSALSTITLALNHTAVMFPNSTQAGQLVMYTATLPSATFMVSNGRSYLCNSLQKFRINETANVTFSRVKVQTADIIDNKFGNESQCPQDTPSTSEAPTTSMAPTPSPFPAPEGWNITNKDNKTCMLIVMSLEFDITYNNTKNKMNHTMVTIPKDADASKSVCGNITSKFVLAFNEGWELTLDFMVDNETKVYNNTKMMLFYVYDNNFVDPKKKGNASVSTDKSGITAAEGKCYSCKAKEELHADNVMFTLHEVKIQPFALKSNQTYGQEAPCPADEDFNNIVPIAVGCALAGLVIIVLIAYLIGRQRSSKSGYESV